MKTVRRKMQRRRTRDRISGTKPTPDVLGEELRSAVHERDIGSVKSLIEEGADVNSKGKADRCTPLHYAASRGCLEIAKLLIEHGAQDGQNHFKQGVVKTAASNVQLEVMELLIKAGFDVDVPDYSGRTALMAVCKWGGAEDSVRLLIEHGADVNLQSENGSSALTTAIGFSRVEMVRMLLDAGASFDVIHPNTDENVLDYAIRREYFGVVKLLLERGAKSEKHDVRLEGEAVVFRSRCRS